MNTPNKLLVFRFVLAILLIFILSFIPFSLKNGFYFEINYFNSIVRISWLNVIGFIIFLVASFTDFLDGYLARKYNQVTDFGKFFDPIADKILVNTTLIFFASFLYIPIWVVVLFIIRDLLVDGLRMNLSTKNIVLPADKLGKLKTIFQMLGLLLLFIYHPISNQIGIFNYNSLEHLFLIPIYIALGFSIASGINYYKKGIGEINLYGKKTK